MSHPSNLVVALVSKVAWLVLAGVFGVVGYKLYILSLQQAGLTVGIPGWLSFRLTSAWPGLFIMVLALACTVTGAIRTKVLPKPLPSPIREGDEAVDKKAPVPADLIAAHKTWFRSGIAIQNMLIALGIISVIASLAVTAFEHELHEVMGGNGVGTRLVAFISAVATGLLSTFGLNQKNRDIWTSWRQVQCALLRYKYDSTYTFLELIKEYAAAEASLGNVVVAVQTKPDTITHT